MRIQLRVPEYGWTTQKVFHLLNALVCSLRCGSFLFRVQMEQLHPDALRLVLFDLPGKHASCRPPPPQVYFLQIKSTVLLAVTTINNIKTTRQRCSLKV